MEFGIWIGSIGHSKIHQNQKYYYLPPSRFCRVTDAPSNRVQIRISCTIKFVIVMKSVTRRRTSHTSVCFLPNSAPLLGLYYLFIRTCQKAKIESTTQSKKYSGNLMKPNITEIETKPKLGKLMSNKISKSLQLSHKWLAKLQQEASCIIQHQ
ncbi:hypothetical protein L484_025692 [Morus notabilis]|uniref:Uncharacterized protein n=1 Tax=Morus notabilis TaxID=981085 RepID=W9RS68_9ROSA|nr:hypothetical protein L484_025692 [Morus notabilis]